MACELCSYEKVTVVHHRDGDPQNNFPNNLQVLCWNCHFLQHHPKGCDGHKKREMLIASNKMRFHRKYFINRLTLGDCRIELGTLARIASTVGLGAAQQKRLNDEMIYNLAKFFILNEMPDSFIAHKRGS